jgi:hypothetical protein
MGQPGTREVREEQIRMMRLGLRVDLTIYRLGYTAMTREAALNLIEQARDEILTLFPGKDEVFEIVLRPRFLRILNPCGLGHLGFHELAA